MAHVNNNKTSIWLDCDPGHDDAFAIVLAACHPDLKLLGISTVHGNASLEHMTANAGSVLAAIGREDVPVYPGSKKPFSRKAVHAPNIHGTSGLDGTTLLPTPKYPPITDINAIIAMRETLLAQPKGTAWLVATGALTNVALLFATFPELHIHIKGLSIMGGAIGGGYTNAPMGKMTGEGERVGNHTRWAEFNIYCDPEAAESIFSNPSLASKTTLIPLDLTHQVLATPAVLDLMLYGPDHSTAQPSSLRRLLYDLLTFFAATYAEVFGLLDGPPLHDPLAVAAILPDYAAFRPLFDDKDHERWNVKIVTDGVHSEIEERIGQLGRTLVTRATKEEGGVKIPRSLDVKRFWVILQSCVQEAEKGQVNL
ncbi:MAG: Uridine nucleosidase 1 [Pycnora praestabilis]|nr:MAG: Uridine nucleosidase 1 [Pycnora praestabilis]